MYVCLCGVCVCVFYVYNISSMHTEIIVKEKSVYEFEKDGWEHGNKSREERMELNYANIILIWEILKK